VALPRSRREREVWYRERGQISINPSTVVVAAVAWQVSELGTG
jgi:hypothetical protein